MFFRKSILFVSIINKNILEQTFSVCQGKHFFKTKVWENHIKGIWWMP